jgi:hypothetical protein
MTVHFIPFCQSKHSTQDCKEHQSEIKIGNEICKHIQIYAATLTKCKQLKILYPSQLKLNHHLKYSM